VDYNRELADVNSPAIDYALRGLARCWLPEHGRWSHIYHLDGRPKPNQSVPHSDVFYTLNVLLGLSRVSRLPGSIRPAEIYDHNVGKLLTLPVSKYAFGVALWSAAELKLDIPAAVVSHIHSILSNKKEWAAFRAQDIGMLLTGIVAQAKLDRKTWSPFADELFSAIVEGYCWPSGLFSDGLSGFRRQFATFASQVYLTIACYAYGEFSGNRRAIELANSCSKRLIELQGPNGEWPWFFDAKKGLVVDFYEVYSVHQYGMAPAFLELAEQNGVAGVRDAVVRGFNWVFGTNQLGKPMLVPELSLSIRSQVRRGELQTTQWRGVRAVRNALLNRSTGLEDPGKLELRQECRSYELGWLIWSFAKRSDYSELTHHTMFAQAGPHQESRSSVAAPVGL
jgi:hypothetical protein